MKGQQSAAAEPAGSRGAAAGTDMACRALGAGACCGGDGTCGVAEKALARTRFLSEDLEEGREPCRSLRRGDEGGNEVRHGHR